MINQTIDYNECAFFRGTTLQKYYVKKEIQTVAFDQFVNACITILNDRNVGSYLHGTDEKRHIFCVKNSRCF